jgi:transposase
MDGKPNRKSEVRLSAEQRQQLERLTRNGVRSAKQIMHARILLMADEDHPLGRYTDAQIGRELGIVTKTVARVRQRFVRGGNLQQALERKHRASPPVAPKLDGKAEATLVALCCSGPPAGRARWTLSLLAEELVERQVVVSICKETVRKTLKKTNCSLGA